MKKCMNPTSPNSFSSGDEKLSGTSRCEGLGTIAIHGFWLLWALDPKLGLRGRNHIVHHAQRVSLVWDNSPAH